MTSIEIVADAVVRAEKMVLFTGAGASTESGIPDFRSPRGIWTQTDPRQLTYQKFLASEEGRERFWDFSRRIWPLIAGARPNPGHYAAAELHRAGKLECVITQNIDGLYQKAGIPGERVLEVHGSARRVTCLECGAPYRREDIQRRLENGEKVPRCRCGGLVKSATVSFGQPMPMELIREAERRVVDCGLLLVAGSSLSVYPAARIPLTARQRGAMLVIVNLTPTPHDRIADVVIRGRVGEVLPQIVAGTKAGLA